MYFTRLVFLLLFSVIAVAIFFLRIYKIDGTSMNYGLVEGDIVLSVSYIDSIKRGDMLVIEHPLDLQNRLYLKRCAAIGGDRFFQKNRSFYLQIESNSTKTKEFALLYNLDIVKVKEGYFIKNPYRKYYGVVHDWSLIVPPPLRDIGITTLPPEHYYMLGDFRDNSADSRFFGAAPRSWVKSKVVYILKKSRDWLYLLHIKEVDDEAAREGNLFSR